MRELTIKEACTSPASFMYVWADDQKFLPYIEARHREIIRGKKKNQVKILMLSADKYLKDPNRWTEYAEAIKKAFIDAFGMTPFNALCVLAEGGTVAGKNWNEGVYGVGSLYTSEFSGYEINGQKVIVDPTDGRILKGSVDITDASKDVIGAGGKITDRYSRGESVTFHSHYYKIKKAWYAQSWSDDNGEFSARTGNAISSIDSSDIWSDIEMLLNKFVEWLTSLFVKDEDKKEPITAENTLPSQKGDGFVQQAGMSTGAKIALALAAGGALLYSTTTSGKKTMGKMFTTKKSRKR